MKRRDFFKVFLGGSVLPFAAPLSASASLSWEMPEVTGHLSLYNINTREKLSIRYMANGEFIPDAMKRLSYLFRCKQTNLVGEMDKKLFVMLDRLKEITCGTDKPFELICGYRNPDYYAKHPKRSKFTLLSHKGAKSKMSTGKNSLHCSGQAADVRLDGVSVAKLRETAITLKTGGVGIYPDFVHLDTGYVRIWKG